MKISIRRNVFETNSSSVHSLTMADQSTMDKWKNKEVIYDRYSRKFIPISKVEEMDEYLKALDMVDGKIDATSWEENLADATINDFEDSYITYQMFIDDNWATEFEKFHQTYKTPAGETIHAFGYYGYN